MHENSHNSHKKRKSTDREERIPVHPPEETDRTLKRSDHSDAEESAVSEPTGSETGEDLRFNPEKGSFEFDTETPDPPDATYQHPDPYDTAVAGALDHLSTYDEANKFTPNEYQDESESIADHLETIDESEARDRFIDLSDEDEKLAETPEDARDDLDEEGYPQKNGPSSDEGP